MQVLNEKIKKTDKWHKSLDKNDRKALKMKRSQRQNRRDRFNLD